MPNSAAYVFTAYLTLFIYWSLTRKPPTKPQDPFNEFTLASRSQSTPAVALSLIATIIGGSATFGVAELAYTKGAIAILWLGVGCLGLTLQALLLAKKVRTLACHSLPEIAGHLVGRSGQRLLATVISLAWLGVIAAQFAGLGKILAAMFPGTTGGPFWITAAGLAVTFYTGWGGQRAVIKTDGLQALWLFAALLLVLGWLFLGDVSSPVQSLKEAFMPADWSGWDAARLTFLVGGAYFVGPDLFSRSCTARDGAVARRAGLLAAGGMLLAAVGITLIGLWTRWQVPAGEMAKMANSPFAYLLAAKLPPVLAWVLALGLAGALLSSADTCLLSVAVMVEVDIVGRNRTGWTRVWLVLTGLAAVLLALRGESILRLLLQSYAVYVPAVVGPMAVALMGRREVRRSWWLAGVIAGGGCGLAGEFLGGWGWLPDPWARPGLALAGVLLSVLLSLWSRQGGQRINR